MARKVKLSRKLQRLLDEFASDVSDNREWDNRHNLKRSRRALVRYLAKLEEQARRGGE